MERCASQIRVHACDFGSVIDVAVRLMATGYVVDQANAT